MNFWLMCLWLVMVAILIQVDVKSPDNKDEHAYIESKELKNENNRPNKDYRMKTYPPPPDDVIGAESEDPKIEDGRLDEVLRKKPYPNHTIHVNGTKIFGTPLSYRIAWTRKTKPNSKQLPKSHGLLQFNNEQLVRLAAKICPEIHFGEMSAGLLRKLLQESLYAALKKNYPEIKGSYAELQSLLENESPTSENYPTEDTRTISRTFTNPPIEVNGETSLEIDMPSKKPDFECNIVMGNFPRVKIHSISCGRQKCDMPPSFMLGSCEPDMCVGQENYKDLKVRYRLLESKRWFEAVTDLGEVFHEYIDYIFPGRMYEVIVVSYSGNLKITSDPKEVFYKPFSSSVQSVEILPLSNKSIVLSWAPPRHSLEPVHKYMVTLSTPVNPHRATFFKKGMLDEINLVKAVNQHDRHHRVFDLWPRRLYTFDIFPVTKDDIFGQGYSIDYEYVLPTTSTLSGLPLAMPIISSLSVKTINYTHSGELCNFYFTWLPCGDDLDCKNARPGKTFRIQIENKSRGGRYESYADEENYFSSSIGWKNDTFKITLEAVNGREFSEADTKEVLCQDKPIKWNRRTNSNEEKLLD